jgi:aquaporin Z
VEQAAVTLAAARSPAEAMAQKQNMTTEPEPSSASAAQDSRGLPWRPFLSEAVGTALLVLVGLSLVTIMFGTGSPIPPVLPNEGLRRLITGFLFGTTGALIALSPVGKVSGAHINPAVTLGFRLMGKIDTGVAFGYIVAQLMGGIVGCVPLLAWGSMGQSVAYGATVPGQGYSELSALVGEVVTTFVMVALLTVFLGFRSIRPFTPAIFPPLYSIMVFLEAPISGTSTNPARSLGPAVVSGQWAGWWIYWVGPLVGMVLALFVCSFMARRIEVAKVYHFDSDHDGIFRRKEAASSI